MYTGTLSGVKQYDFYATSIMCLNTVGIIMFVWRDFSDNVFNG